MRSRTIIRGLVAAVVAAALCAAPAFGAAFGIFEQGSKAMGTAGAFTGRADDGSAMFHNVGGLGFQKERSFMAGTTLISLAESEFDGLDPFPGDSATGEQETHTFTPSHIYYVQPINDRLTFGLGVNNPFALATDWGNKNEWPGRFLSIRASLTTFDFNPSIGWQVTDNLSIGAGLIYRLSSVELLRRAPAVNPFTQQVTDVASVYLESDLDDGFGWNVGFLHKANKYFSWGISYRSKVEVDYAGDGRFTQIETGFPQFDAAVAAGLPFDQDLPIETSIEFPDMASLGFALQVTQSATVLLDANWTGWSSFDSVFIDFTNADQFDNRLNQDYDDAYNYRIGVELATSGGNFWRLGYVYDETPQPEKSVGPLLPDANRNGITLGFGWGDRLDVAFMYLDFDDRTTTTNEDGFFGSYETTAYLLGLTLKL